MKNLSLVSFSFPYKILFLLGFSCFSNSTFAQRVSIEGKIVSTENIDIEGINIINLNSNYGTVSDESGNFKISVSIKDSLSVSAVHIQETIVVIGEEQLADKKIVIHLNEKNNLLKEVMLMRALTGYIGTDINIIPTEEPITATSIGLPNADLPKLSKAESLLYATNSGSLAMLLGAITGKTKRLEKRIELENTAQLTENLLDKFPLTFFVDVLNIEQFKVYPFLFFCEADPEYKNVLKQNTMKIVEFLERKSREFHLQINQK